MNKQVVALLVAAVFIVVGCGEATPPAHRDAVFENSQSQLIEDDDSGKTGVDAVFGVLPTDLVTD